MPVTCKHCSATHSGNPLFCARCGIQLRKEKLNWPGRILMMLLLAGWVIAPTGILYLLYLVITDPGFTVTAFCWKVIACVAGAYLYFKFLEAFEGFARPQ